MSEIDQESSGGEFYESGVSILCRFSDGSWLKIEHPPFQDTAVAIDWLREELLSEDYSDDDEFFVSRKLTSSDFKAAYKKE